MIRVLLLSSLVVLVAGFGSCEVSCGTKKLDPKKAEELIRESFATGGAVITKVSCPEVVKYKEGASFTCTATAENGDILEVELTHGDNKATITRSDNIVAMAKVSAKIAEMIAENPATKSRKFGPARCPKDKKAVKDARFRCSAPGDEGTTLLLDVLERDGEGNLSIVFAGVAVEPKALAKQLEAMLARKTIKATVSCGDAPVRLMEKMEAACEATDADGKVASLELRTLSPYGEFDWRIVVKK